MERRTLLKGLAAGLTGAVAAPGQAGAAASEPASAPLSKQAAAPVVFLDEYQRRTLASLADLLLPGAVAAGVVELIDRVASVDSQARQRQLLNALAQFEQAARAAHGRSWIELDAASRTGILKESAETVGAMHDSFDYLRRAVTTAYFATEAGMKEFGWAGRSAWKELPACTHPNPEH
jgi:hypothetical protein